MEERNIKISLDKARDWYNRGGEYKELALSAFTEKEIKASILPNTWEEFLSLYPIKEGECYIDHSGHINTFKSRIGNARNPLYDLSVLPSQEAAKAHLALMQLHQLRDCYRQGWVPDWKDSIIKYCIVLESNIPVIYKNLCTCNFLSFQSEEIARKFLNNFKDLIETARDLI